ncbi:hypothetical protein TNCV_2595051 [Trichonephila clavipes]|nr:hypothetical protein TNCV_2595051 [Trichonephila clavipes]
MTQQKTYRVKELMNVKISHSSMSSMLVFVFTYPTRLTVLSDRFSRNTLWQGVSCTTVVSRSFENNAGEKTVLSWRVGGQGDHLPLFPFHQPHERV